MTRCEWRSPVAALDLHIGDDIANARYVARMCNDAVKLRLVERRSHQIDNAVHCFDGIVEAAYIAVGGKPRAQLGGDRRIADRLRKACSLAGLQLVDDFLHTADRPDDACDREDRKSTRLNSSHV